MIGTRGVPAHYGGFETAVEEVGGRLVARGHEVTVFCRGSERKRDVYRGMRLVHLPALRLRTAETLSHTALSLIHPAARGADVAFVFNAANGPLLPLLKAAQVPSVVHVDGLEWRRSKWGKVGRRYYLASEGLAVRWADTLIADALGIQDYYRMKYQVQPVYIPYGAPIHLQRSPSRLRELGLEARRYHLVVARFEPENHVHLALAGYAQSRRTYPLVVVGSAPYSRRYVASIQEMAARHRDIRMIGGIWDQDLLDDLYAGALTYVHGHSVGGTNPSLLRAMGAGAPVCAFDVVFNREVLQDTGEFWSDADELAQLLEAAERFPEQAEARGASGQRQAAARYTWDGVTASYEAAAYRLVVSG